MREWDAEGGRRRLLAIRHGQRDVASVDRERVDAHDPAADELLHEAVLAPRSGQRLLCEGRERSTIVGQLDGAFACPVRRLEHDRKAELPPRARGFVRRAAHERTRLGQAGLREPLALSLPRDCELRRLGGDRMRQGEPRGNPCSDRDRVVGAGRHDPVDLFGSGQAFDRRLVLDRDDRPPVCVPEARRRRIAVGCDHERPGLPGRREDAELRRAGPQDEQPRHAAILAEAAVGAPGEHHWNGGGARRLGPCTVCPPCLRLRHTLTG
jgi:hypothetical protein